MYQPITPSKHCPDGVSVEVPVLQTLQILNQVLFLLLGQVQSFERVIVVDYIHQCGEATIVIKTALGCVHRPFSGEVR